MPSIAMTVPYMRTSPIHIPRRDLVLGQADSLYFRVIVVDSDNPCAQALELSGGIGGPAAQFLVWPDIQPRYGYGNWHDYGWRYPCSAAGQVLFNGTGVPGDALGSFDFTFSPNTMASWPRRCGWSIQLAWDHSEQVSQLAWGRLHVMWSMQLVPPEPIALTTDDGTAITPDSAILVA